MSITAQIVDQRVRGILKDKEDYFINEIRIGNALPKLKSVSFIYLVAQTVLRIDDDEIIDGIVDGGKRFWCGRHIL